MRPFITALLVFPLLLVTARPSTGQDLSNPSKRLAPAAERMRGPILTEADGTPVKGVRLARAALKAVVRGTLAQATMTLTFANTENRVLGGEVLFPLPEGATVTGYALEINGLMVEGVAVEKQQARVIYEKELHKRVDPGLVEQAAGNVFRTRLYPVPASGNRSIRVQFVTEVSTTKSGAAIVLPLGWAGDGAISVIEVDAPDAKDTPTANVDGLTFEKAEHGYRGHCEPKSGPDELVIALPNIPERSVSIEKQLRPTVTMEDLDEQATEVKGHGQAKTFEQFEHYFVVNDTLPAEVEPAAAARKAQHVAILWDAGLTRADADKARELHLLDEILKHLGAAQADLVVFRDTVEKPKSYDLSKVDDRGQMIEDLSRLTYDGASDLGHLPLPGSSGGFSAEGTDKSVAYDCLLLFTNGLTGIGAETMQKAQVPVYAFADDTQANHVLLRHVCRESGGAYFNLKRLTDEQVLENVGREPLSLVSIDSKAGEVTDIYPGPGVAIQGRLAIAGRLLAPQAMITLNYGFGKRVVHSQEFTLNASDATEGNLLPRYWAQQKVAELSQQPGVNAEELAQTGRRFNLVTPNTSLLVLETADQYVQYRVVPPKTQPEIYKQFMARIEQNKAEEHQTREQKIQQVAALWNDRVKWWEQGYKYPANLRFAPPAEQPLAAAGGRVLNDGSTAPATRPAQQRGLASNDAITAGEAPAFFGTPQGGPGRAPGERAAEISRHTSASAAAGGGLPAVAIAAAPAPAPDPRAGPTAANGQVAARLQQQAQQNASPRHDRQVTVDELAKSVDQLDDANKDVRATRDRPQPTEAPSRHINVGGVSAEQPITQPDMRDAGAVREQVLERRTYAIQDLALAVPDFQDAPAQADSSSAIAVRQWDPATPYLMAMKAAAPDKAYEIYLQQRKTFGKSPAFYFDCGDLLEHLGQHAMAVRVLTDVAALRLADARLLRVAAHRLQQIGERERAIELFEAVLKIRPEEPQSHRDLALALADRADASTDAHHQQSGQIASDYGRSLDLLNQVIVGHWDRFQEIELPCLMEANRIIATVERLKQAGQIAEVPIALDARLRKNLDCDLRVVMTWDADNTDIDLWVTEPSGEKCFYGHNRTTIGGLLSRDFTDGYGPEEYCLRKNMPGKYQIQANFFGSHQQELTGPCTVQATVITDFGRPNEKRKSLTLRLVEAKEVFDIGAADLGTAKPAQ